MESQRMEFKLAHSTVRAKMTEKAEKKSEDTEFAALREWYKVA